MNTILDVKNLSVSFDVYGGAVQAVRDLSLAIGKGEAIAIVGESGSGKSVTARAIMRLISSPPGRIHEGSIWFNGQDLLQISEKEMQSIRGNKIGMIFQDPMTSLNPTLTIGIQIAEGLMKHQSLKKADAKAKSIELLDLVGIPNAESRFSQYPHQFSGGMRQRVVIAIALACNPTLLIADEPTTALDVTIQAQILQLLKNLQKDLGTSIILITHDLGIVADLCERVFVMYAGQIVENATKREIFLNPQHPYTKGLLKSLPRLDQKKDEPLIPIMGTPPDLINPPKGCAFFARCQYAMRICENDTPPTTIINDNHSVRCWLQHPNAQATGDSEAMEVGR